MAKKGFTTAPVAQEGQAAAPAVPQVETINAAAENAAALRNSFAAKVAPAPAVMPDMSDILAAPGSADSLLIKMLQKVMQLEQENAALKAAKGAAEERDNPNVASASHASSLKRIRINVHESNDENPLDPVPVSPNSRTYQLKRGHEVDVPPEVVEGLANAIEIRYAKAEDEKGRMSMKPRRVPRFPYTVIGVAVNEKGERLLPALDAA